MKRILIFVVFFIVLFGLFYLFTFEGTDSFKSKLPAISYVKPFRFTTENGTDFTDKDMAGKVCVVNYFFTTCKGICPRMNNNMHDIYKEFKNEPEFMIVSHTCDPQRDSVATLKHYADSLKVDTDKWVFLTGRKDSLYMAARTSYLLDDPNNNVKNVEDQFLHTQFFALVDKNGEIRHQIYDGLKKDDLKKLKKDIKDLLKEEAKSL